MYLDNAATTPLSKEVKEYLINLLDEFGNPSSQYGIGSKIRKSIDNARNNIAKFINADSNCIYFTSGGSASNTLAIRGFYNIHNCSIYYSPIAHKSILKYVSKLHNSNKLYVNSNGKINLNYLELCMKTCNNIPFVVIDYANSEIGTIQDIEKIIDIVHKYKGIIYLDCTGSISTIKLDVKKINCDMCGFSAHKLGALKGCGVLFKKKPINLEPLIYGNQEKGLVGGTENTLGILSLSKSIEKFNYSDINSINRDYVYEYIKKNVQDCYILGSAKDRLANNLYICFKGVEGESLEMLLDNFGYQVSTGSACNSGNLTPSNTLKEIGICDKDIYDCIRITFNCKENRNELQKFCETLKQCVETIRAYQGE